MGVHWPEFRSCFGLCSLKSGVYVVASFGTFLNALSVITNVLVFYDLVLKRKEIFTKERGIDEWHLPDARQTLLYWLKILQGYIIAWILFKCIILLTNLLLFYGISKSKKKIIKLYLYINFQGWILTVINAAIIAVFFNVFFKFFVVVYVLLDGYKLLVVRSAYRQMTGKQRFLDNDEIDTNVQQTFESPPQYTCPSITTPHCTSCTCILTEERLQRHVPEELPQKEINLLTTTPSVDDSESLPVTDSLKDSPVIFDPNQLIRVQDEVVQTEKEEDAPEKVVKENIVIIFDENQLNLGPSPIYEEIPFTNHGLVNENHVIPSTSNREVIDFRINNKTEADEVIENTSKQIKAIRPTTLNIYKF